MKVSIKSDDGEVLATVEMKPKVFKTGSRGLIHTGKAEYGGRKYQLNFQAIEVGSKNGSK